MARTKKEAALTLEERLQAALVPDWEWPYKLPGNWCWLKLAESFDNHTDSKKKVQQKDYLTKGKIAVVDQGQELIGGYTNDVEKSYSGVLPIVVFGDHTRRIKFVDFPFAQGQSRFICRKHFIMHSSPSTFLIWGIVGTSPFLTNSQFHYPHSPSSTALLTALKACLLSWMRRRKRHRL